MTAPSIPLGPLRLQTFGLFVALAAVAGLGLTTRRARRAGLPSEELAALCLRLLAAGLAGARLAWALSEWRAVAAEPWRVLAVWDGGLQFFGGFLAALALLAKWLCDHPHARRWDTVDLLAAGLAPAMAIGRLGCVAVGEHLGRPTRFPLAVTYRGGELVEGPLALGSTIHHPALYEAVLLGLLGLALGAHLRWPARSGVPTATFLVAAGAVRFGLDSLRAHDERVLGLTFAQAVAVGMAIVGLETLRRLTRPIQVAVPAA